MSEDTQTHKPVSEEEQERVDTQRWTELKGKEELNEDEQKEKEQLREKYGERMQKKIDKFTYQIRERDERLEKTQAELEELKKKLEQSAPSQPQAPVRVSEETVAYGNKQYFTDTTLQSKVDAGEMTSQEAYAHQRARDRAEDLYFIEQKLEEKNKSAKEQEEMKVRQEDAENVLKEYPQFSTKHPDFNPDDPLYKEATSLYEAGLINNPRGMSLAIKKAKQILGLDKKHPDLSDNLGLRSPSTPSDNKPKEVVLDADEQEAAYRQYVLGNQVNPKTGRVYTRDEALVKAKKAKQERVASRRIT